jgi:hypothetical protein
VQQSHVFDFFFQCARLSAAGVPPETRAAGAQRPGGNGYLEGFHFVNNLLNVNAFPSQQFSGVLKVEFVFRAVFLVQVVDLFLDKHGLSMI